jgi:hypothetical protein
MKAFRFILKAFLLVIVDNFCKELTHPATYC